MPGCAGWKPKCARSSATWRRAAIARWPRRQCLFPHRWCREPGIDPADRPADQGRHAEGQLTRLTAQNEEAGNRIRLLETRWPRPKPRRAPAPVTDPAAPTGAAFDTDGSAGSSNLRRCPLRQRRCGRQPTTVNSAKPAATRPSAQRLAAVRAVVKPQTDDPGDDEYSYGYRLWDAKLYPEAEQQLKLFLDKYPRHPRVSHARNLMGRACSTRTSRARRRRGSCRTTSPTSAARARPTACCCWPMRCASLATRVAPASHSANSPKPIRPRPPGA